MDYDVYAEVDRLFLTAYENKPSYAGIGGDRVDAGVELAHEVQDARYELTRTKPGLDVEDVDNAIAALTAGEKDTTSQILALVQLQGMHAPRHREADPAVPVLRRQRASAAGPGRPGRGERAGTARPGEEGPRPAGWQLPHPG